MYCEWEGKRGVCCVRNTAERNNTSVCLYLPFLYQPILFVAIELQSLAIANIATRAHG